MSYPCVILVLQGRRKRERQKMATIWFDLDGTIYDLYGVENWLEKLRSSDTTPYENGSALVDLAELESVLEELGEDYEVGVITWLAMGASKEYDKES